MKSNGNSPQKSARDAARAVRSIAERDPELGYLAVCAVLSSFDADEFRRFSAEDCEMFRGILRRQIEARSFRPAQAPIALSYPRRESPSPLQKVADYFRDAQDLMLIGAIDWARQNGPSRAA